MEKINKLKDEIYKKYWSIGEFCEEAKIDKSTLYKLWEGRSKRIRKSTAELIAKALDKQLMEIKELIN